jgi:uncharacterized protein (DUF58 family)
MTVAGAALPRAPQTQPPPVAATDDTRRQVASLRRRQALRWGLVVGLIALLVSLFSAGFFLYAAVVAAAVMALAALLPAASLARVEVRRSLGAAEIELGDSVESRLVFLNRKDFPALWLFWREAVDPGLDAEGLTCGFQTLESEQTIHTVCILHSTRRGLFRVGPMVVEASDPFGLVRRFRVDSEVRFLTVVPRAVPIGQGWPLGHRPIHEVPRRRSPFEDPARFLGVRDYRHGDSLRRIHWRATARSGVLQVKLFEPAVLEGVLLAVEMGRHAYPRKENEAAGSDPAVELAVTAAASVAEFVLTAGQSVGLLSNGGDAAESFPADWQGGSFRRYEDALEDANARRLIAAYRPLEVPPGRGVWQRDHLRTALARLTLAPGLTLPELLLAEAPRLPRSHVVMVVTPDLGAATGGALAALKRSGFDVGVIWIQRGRAEAAAAGLLEGIPVYPVGSEADLEQLGAQAL